eukprot:1652588-Rhodomonas_salina.1
MMLDQYETDQFKALQYLICECNYGGRVTDDKDRRYLNCAMADYYLPAAYTDGYALSPSGNYTCPDGQPTYDEVMEWIGGLPAGQEPEVFGLHDNADITKDQQETDYLCDTLLLTEEQGGGGGGAAGGKSEEEVLLEVSGEIVARVPLPFDNEPLLKRFPIRFDESMNTVPPAPLASLSSRPGAERAGARGGGRCWRRS